MEKVYRLYWLIYSQLISSSYKMWWLWIFANANICLSIHWLFCISLLYTMQRDTGRYLYITWKSLALNNVIVGIYNVCWLLIMTELCVLMTFLVVTVVEHCKQSHTKQSMFNIFKCLKFFYFYKFLPRRVICCERANYSCQIWNKLPKLGVTEYFQTYQWMQSGSESDNKTTAG